MPTCAETNCKMQELTGLQHNSGEKNKDMTTARKQCDMKDTLTVLTALTKRNPFLSDPSLRNIMTGLNADIAVSVDAARAVGKKILTTMTGQSVTDYVHI